MTSLRLPFLRNLPLLFASLFAAGATGCAQLADLTDIELSGDAGTEAGVATESTEDSSADGTSGTVLDASVPFKGDGSPNTNLDSSSPKQTDAHNDGTIPQDAALDSTTTADSPSDSPSDSPRDTAPPSDAPENEDTSPEESPDGSSLLADWSPCLFQTATRYDCPDVGETAVDVQLVPPAAACNCACGAGTGATCDTGMLVVVNSTSCAGASPYVLSIDNDACIAASISLTSTLPADYFKETAGSITCGAPTNTLPAVPDGRLCESSTTEPSPGAPYLACVWKAGNWPCPSGFPMPYEVGTSVTDTRNCECGCAEDVSCVYTVNLFPQASCGGTPTLIGPTCGSVPTATYASYKVAGTLESASCTSYGNTDPTGTATPVSQTTVCCP